MYVCGGCWGYVGVGVINIFGHLSGCVWGGVEKISGETGGGHKNFGDNKKNVPDPMPPLHKHT